MALYLRSSNKDASLSASSSLNSDALFLIEPPDWSTPARPGSLQTSVTHTHTLTVALCPAAGDSSHALWLLCAACLPARPRRSIFINSGVNTSEAEFPPGLIASVASKIAFPPLSPHFRPYWPAKGSLSAAARRNCIKCAETVCRWDPDGWFAHALTQ